MNYKEIIVITSLQVNCKNIQTKVVKYLLCSEWYNKSVFKFYSCVKYVS